MRLLFWIVAISFAPGIAEAQLSNSDARLPGVNSLSGPPHAQRPLMLHESTGHVALPSRELSGHVYHGRNDWARGQWHHSTRNGLFGWWWDVGGAWYLYPDQLAGPPTYVSDTEAVEETTSRPGPPEQSRHVFYYRPGELKGVPYDTIEACTKAIQQAGNIGICVLNKIQAADANLEAAICGSHGKEFNSANGIFGHIPPFVLPY